jgi:hypothetical protein
VQAVLEESAAQQWAVAQRLALRSSLKEKESAQMKDLALRLARLKTVIKACISGHGSVIQIAQASGYQVVSVRADIMNFNIANHGRQPVDVARKLLLSRACRYCLLWI